MNFQFLVTAVRDLCSLSVLTTGNNKFLRSPLPALLCTASFGASANAVADCSRAPHLDAAPDLALLYQVFQAALFLAAR